MRDALWHYASAERRCAYFIVSFVARVRLLDGALMLR